MNRPRAPRISAHWTSAHRTSVHRTSAYRTGVHWTGVLLLLPAALDGCQRRPAPVQATQAARYVVGPAWQGQDGAWFYPREPGSFDATGLAVIDRTPSGQPVADGEAYDLEAMVAAVQTLPLPSVLRVRDLDTGRSLFVRAIARGPADPGRLLALSPAAAALLGMRSGQPARVQVTLDAGLSQQLQSALAGAPHLAIAQAPVEAVTEQALGPPGGAPAAAAQTAAAPTSNGADNDGAAPVAIPAGVQQGPAMPGDLWVDGGRFDGAGAARSVADAMGGQAQREGGGRQAVWRVLAGPFASVAQADAALDRARHGGVTGAHIIVE